MSLGRLAADRMRVQAETLRFGLVICSQSARSLSGAACAAVTDRASASAATALMTPRIANLRTDLQAGELRPREAPDRSVVRRQLRPARSSRQHASDLLNS